MIPRVMETLTRPVRSALQRKTPFAWLDLVALLLASIVVTMVFLRYVSG